MFRLNSAPRFSTVVGPLSIQTRRRLTPSQRVLDLRGGTELTLEACLATIRSLLTEAGIHTLTWDHPVSEPTRESTPAAKPLIDRLGQLYPDPPEIVDPEKPASS